MEPLGNPKTARRQEGGGQAGSGSRGIQSLRGPEWNGQLNICSTIRGSEFRKYVHYQGEEIFSCRKSPRASCRLESLNATEGLVSVLGFRACLGNPRTSDSTTECRARLELGFRRIL